MRFSFLYFGLAVPAMGILVPPTRENLSPDIEGNTFDGKTTCPRGTNTYCCDSLDYSGFQVECIGRNELIFQSRTETSELTITKLPGPGKVDYLEECLNYEPRPMCCCVYELIPDMPHVSDKHSSNRTVIAGIMEWPSPKQIAVDVDVDDNNSNPSNQIPREISCDADCHALKEPKANDKVTLDL
ncbi:hypothetical protein QR685DRAFT_521503 [Neurospora intermedia]|uniref:Hydrophobin n=1 Tax=Neurospora intermedia TaxID=5142 RepID=A0ABR3DIR9_NEUIN